MYRFKINYIVIFLLNLSQIRADLPKKCLCADSLCTEVVSFAKTLQNYPSAKSGVLSFKSGEDVKVFGKSDDPNAADLWEVEIDGKRGYVPKSLIRETKVEKSASVLVEKAAVRSEQNVEPDKVQKAYEVVDGTTIYKDVITPTSPQDNVQPTASVPTGKTAGTPPVQPDLTSSESKLATNETVMESFFNTLSGLIVGDENQQDDEEDEADVEEDEESGEVEEPEETVPSSTEKVKSGEENSVVRTVDSESVEKLNPSENKSEENPKPLGNKIEENPKLVEKKSEENPKPLGNKIEENLKPVEKKSEENPKPLGNKIEENPKTVEKKIEDNPKLVENKSEENLKTVDFKSAENPKLLGNKSEENPKTVENNSGGNPKTVENESEEKRKLAEETSKNETENSEKLKITDLKNNEIPTTVEINSKDSESGAVKNEGKFKVLGDTFFKDSSKISVDENLKTVAEGPENSKIPTISLEGEPEVSLVESAKPGVAETPEKSDVKVTPVTEEQEIKVEANDTTNEENLTSQEEKGNSENATIEQQTTTTTPLFEEVPELIIDDVTEVPAADGLDTEAPILSLEESTEVNEDTGKLNEAVPNNLGEATDVEESEENLRTEETPSPSLMSRVFSIFGGASSVDEEIGSEENPDKLTSTAAEYKNYCSEDASSTCSDFESSENSSIFTMDFFALNSNFLLYLATTAVAVITFLIFYAAIDKSKREGPLVAKINKLEKELLLLVKENELLQTKIVTNNDQLIPNEFVENLKQELFEANNVRAALEEQIQSLEKELESSTEVGIEFNKMLSDILSSERGSDVLKANIEQLQKQLIEQQSMTNNTNACLAQSEMENHELKLEVEISNKKVTDLQREVDKLLQNVWKIEEEKDQQQSILENQITHYKSKYEEIYSKFKSKEEQFDKEVSELNRKLHEASRDLSLKVKEFNLFKEASKLDADTARAFLDVSTLRAELDLLRTEKQNLVDKLQKLDEVKTASERNEKVALDEMQQLRLKYSEAEKLKVEAETKLDVLSNYFKEKEAHLQKEINKHEELWAERQGEASSTTERIRFLQEQLQNIKSQNESLKQEIVNQEVELKSHISMLEKKVHENWVSARQLERKLEDAKHEAAQLRHRLTLRERAIQEEKGPRLLSPLEHNGDLLHHHNSTASPPLLYSANRDHITKSPPIPPPGLPFLPPPPPFLPHPIHGVPPPLLPPLPPPNLFPGDHRPPPLGRLSSPPPPTSRYSPTDSRAYSPYTSRHSSSPPSDSEYGVSPPPHRGYSPFNDRRDYGRVHAPPFRTNGPKRPSSDSANSNESTDKPNRYHNSIV